MSIAVVRPLRIRGENRDPAGPLPVTTRGWREPRSTRKTIHHRNLQHILQVPFRPILGKLPDGFREVLRVAQEFARSNRAVLRQATGDNDRTVGGVIERAQPR